jgi:hypothetical protein
MTATFPIKVKEIIEVGDHVLRNNAEYGRIIAEILGTVTNVRRVVNETDQSVTLWKKDGWKGEQTVRIQPNTTSGMEMWIPWADSATQYNNHRMEIRVGSQVIGHLWQSGSQVRFNASNQWVKDGYAVAGEAKAGGDRTLLVGKDSNGKLGFSFAGHKK